MNSKTLIDHPPYNIKRIVSKICMVLAKQSLTTPKIRLKMLKLGG